MNNAANIHNSPTIPAPAYVADTIAPPPASVEAESIEIPPPSKRSRPDCRNWDDVSEWLAAPSSQLF